MKRSVMLCRLLFDRGVALLFLIVLAPSLALVAFLLRTNTDQPILLTDEVVTPNGEYCTYRFRTTGRGTGAFRFIGRVLRWCSIDEVPGLWAVVRGQHGLAHFLSLGRSE